MMVEITAIHQEARDMAKFRSRLKELMLIKGMKDKQPLSQTEVAKVAGVSFATVQRLYDPDNKFKRVDADTLYGLLDYFECKFEDLIERVEE